MPKWSPPAPKLFRLSYYRASPDLRLYHIISYITELEYKAKLLYRLRGRVHSILSWRLEENFFQLKNKIKQNKV